MFITIFIFLETATVSEAIIAFKAFLKTFAIVIAFALSFICFVCLVLIILFVLIKIII
jgi:hypothetical protein